MFVPEFVILFSDRRFGIAKKKYTAKAESGSWNADLKTRRGYWDHRDYMFTPGDF